MLALARSLTIAPWVTALISSHAVLAQAFAAAVAMGTTFIAFAVMVAMTLAAVFALIIFVVIAALFMRLAGAR